MNLPYSFFYVIDKPAGGKKQFRSELAKKGRVWACAGSGGRRGGPQGILRPFRGHDGVMFDDR